MIDPRQSTDFSGLGLCHVEEADLSDRITFFEEPAELRLPQLLRDGVRVDFAFNDGLHLFDHVITDFVLLAQLLRQGGLLLFDDTNLAGVGRACDFIATNRSDFCEIVSARRFFRARAPRHPEVPPPPDHMRLFCKLSDEDSRTWQHFKPF